MTLPHDSGHALALPSNARILHIGPPKTGTTAIQTAVQAARDTLYDHGVFYPGTGRNHRRAIFALMDRPESRVRRPEGRDLEPGRTRNELESVPPREVWDRLMAEIESEPNRKVLISNELAAGSTPEQAQRFVDELGRGRTQVIITLRPKSAILPSAWIESIKVGQRQAFETWLKRVYGVKGNPVPEGTAIHLDHGRVVEIWAAVAGPENVTVIVLDPRNKALLTDAFEQLLDVPAGTLSEVESESLYANRSMTLAEATVFRRLNVAAYHRDDQSWPAYLHTITHGAITHVLSTRTPPADEPRVRLPRWAADRAMADARRDVQRIRASGVRVVGDLDVLLTEPKVATERELRFDRNSSPIPASLAVDALVGAYQGAQLLEKAATRSRKAADATAVTKGAVAVTRGSAALRLRDRLRRLARRARSLARRVTGRR